MIRYILFLLLIFILCIYLQFKTITYETFALTEVSPNFLVANTGLESLLSSDFFNGIYTTSYSLTYAGEIATQSIWTANYSNYGNNATKTGYSSLIHEIYSELYNDVKAKFEDLFAPDICNNLIAYNSNWDLSKATAMGCYFNKYYEPCIVYNNKTYVWAKVSFPLYSPSSVNELALNLVSDTTTMLGGTLRLGYVETWVDVSSSLLHPLSGFNVTTTITTESKRNLLATITSNTPGTVPTRSSNGTLPFMTDSKFQKIPILHEGNPSSLDSSYNLINDNGDSVLMEEAQMGIAGSRYYPESDIPAEVIPDKTQEIVSNYLDGHYLADGNRTTIEVLFSKPNLNHRDAGKPIHDDVPLSAKLPGTKYKCKHPFEKKIGIYKHVVRDKVGLTNNLNMITTGTEDNNCHDLSFELYDTKAKHTKWRKQVKKRIRNTCRGAAFAEACKKIKVYITKQSNDNRAQEAINSGLIISQGISTLARTNWQSKITEVLEDYFAYCNENNVGHTGTVFCSGRILIITWNDGEINWYVAAKETPNIDTIQKYSEVENAIELDIVSDITEPPSRSERIPDREIDTLSSSDINEERARFAINVDNLSNTCVGKIFHSLYIDSDYGAKNVYLNDIKNAYKIPTFCPVEGSDKNYKNIFEGDIVQFLNHSYNIAKTNMQNTFKGFSEDSMVNLISDINGKMQSVIDAEGTGHDVNIRNKGIHIGVENALGISGGELV